MENIKMKKDYSISLIRLISTLAIVILHITQQMEHLVNDNFKYITDWLNLGLVLFFAISAYLYSNREIKLPTKWFAKRYIELAVPSIFVVIITLLTFGVYEKISYSAILSSLGAGLGLEVFMPDSWMFIQLWFLTYILFCYLTVPLIQHINVKKISSPLFWFLIISSTFVAQISGSLISKIGLISLSWGILLRFYLPYFIFKKYEIRSKKCKNVMMLLSVLSVFCIVFTCYIRYFCEPEGIFASLAELIFIYTQTLTGTVLFFWLYKIFDSIKKNEKILSYTDKFSYPVYLTHCLFIGYSTSVIANSKNIFIGIIAALILTVFASLITYFVTDKIKKYIILKIKL